MRLMCYHFEHGFVAITELGMDMEILWRKALCWCGFRLDQVKRKRMGIHTRYRPCDRVCFFSQYLYYNTLHLLAEWNSCLPSFLQAETPSHRCHSQKINTIEEASSKLRQVENLASNS